MGGLNGAGSEVAVVRRLTCSKTEPRTIWQDGVSSERSLRYSPNRERISPCLVG